MLSSNRRVHGAGRATAIASLAIASLALLASCRRAEPPAADQIRPVRTVTVSKNEGGDVVSLTGHLYAQDEVSLAFRIGGRMIERSANIGDHVTAGQVVARLDAATAHDAVDSARANTVAARAQLVQTQNALRRQAELLHDGWTTRALFDETLAAQQTAQARVDLSEAQLNTARINLGYTDLVADTAGVVTARGAEPGEVVAAGQMILQVAHQGGRDAVFDMPARVIATAPANAELKVSLVTDPAVQAIGRVREVAPQADPVTRTFQVRVGLNEPPEAMRLGSTVTGLMQTAGTAGIDIPASALTTSNSQPAVWIVDPATSTVSLRNIDVQRFDTASVVVAGGLSPGDVVVDAGVQSLRPGEKVRLLGAAR